MVHKNTLADWPDLLTYLPDLERRQLITRTFRRLDPERQATVVGAILAEAMERGPTHMNIKHIAKRAGVAVGSLYQYFGNRAGLLAFVVSLAVQVTVDQFQACRPQLAALPWRTALEAYLLGGLEWSQMQSGFVQFFAQAAYRGDETALQKSLVQPVAVVMREIVQDILQAAQARGEVRADLDIEAAARVINTWLIVVGDSQLMPHLNVYFQVTDKKLSFQRAFNVLLDVLEHGLAGDKQ